MPSLSTVVLADNPVAYWPMNETSGTTFSDASGNARHATINGSGITLANTNGPCDGSGRKAPKFNGNSSTYAKTSNDNVFRLNGGFTVEMWFRNDATGNSQAICGFAGPGTSEAGGWRVSSNVTSGNLGWNTRRDSSTGGNQVINDKAFTCFRHLVWRYDESNTLGDGSNRNTMWRDGSVTNTWTYTYPNLSDTDGFSMARNGVTNNGFKGWLCNVAIYDSPLTDARLVTHWEVGSCVACGGVAQDEGPFVGMIGVI